MKYFVVIISFLILFQCLQVDAITLIIKIVRHGGDKC